MKRENFIERISALKEGRQKEDLVAVAEMRASKSAIVFQGRKRYVEAEEEE